MLCRSLILAYYRGAMGILLVYDVCDERSFNSNNLLLLSLMLDIRTWFQNVEQHATEGVHNLLIGNKCDWTEKRVISEDQGRALAQELGIPFMETSAKSNINVEEAFFSLARYTYTLPILLTGQGHQEEINRFHCCNTECTQRQSR